MGWGRGILSQKNWGLWFYCGSVTGQACGGEQRDGGVFVRATDRDAGRTLEVSGRVGGGVGEVDWAGIGGSTALGGGVKKKGNGRGGLVEGSAWPGPRCGGVGVGDDTGRGGRDWEIRIWRRGGVAHDGGHVGSGGDTRELGRARKRSL